MGTEDNSGVYVYEIRKPGSDLDGTPTWFSAFDGRAAADRKVLARSELLGGAELVYVGRGWDMDSERNRRFEPAIETDHLPWWAAQWLAEQEERSGRGVAKAKMHIVPCSFARRSAS